MLKLRPYQEEIKAKVYQQWDIGHKNVLLVMPTGLGKTKTFSSITIDMAVLAVIAIKDKILKYPTAIMVHRKELVQQICLTLAEEGIPHNIIAPRNVIKGIIAAERLALNKQFYDYNASVTVISVDTLNARILKHEQWAKSIRLWITDEAAHVLRGNKWGRALEYFPNAIGLGVTATPERLDKRGLGRHADGVFDVMVEGPSTRWGIEHGFLSNYKVVVPKSDYREHLKDSGNSGSDFSKEAMIQASRGSHIVGDIVKTYLEFAKGKQAIVFADSIETGARLEKEFIAKGVTAKLLTGETEDDERLRGLMDFKAKKTQVLINVDLFDEGLDVPGIEVVIMGRPTKSVSKYLQQCGRGLRPDKRKPYMILVDHVGNVKTHGLPCSRRAWTLDRLVRRRDRVNLIRICQNFKCNSVFDRLLSTCPYCGWEDKPGTREGGGKLSLEQVDGDLFMLDPEDIRAMEQASRLEDPGSLGERVSKAAGAVAGMRAANNQRERIATQNELALVLAQWAGLKRHQGLTDRMIHKDFFAHYDMSMTHALSMPKAEMLELIGELEPYVRIYRKPGNPA